MDRSGKCRSRGCGPLDTSKLLEEVGGSILTYLNLFLRPFFSKVCEIANSFEILMTDVIRAIVVHVCGGRWCFENSRPSVPGSD